MSLNSQKQYREDNVIVCLPGEEDRCLSISVVRLESVKHILQVLGASQLWET